ncbi:hypothetical protein HNO51_12195 [Billgrantia sulfidoxydans]|uniref:Uncharacterized protein n=1 Tax=Billgrantia sulfidoxydans TaxID=2733484 RepID=A0ABX7W8Q2_9GAMM|nr:hypothetical protein HNO51_12195 [Halomonas sulfidoxydans]
MLINHSQDFNQHEWIRHDRFFASNFFTPEPQIADPLHELLRQDAHDLIAKAVEAELATFLTQYADQRLDDGRQAVVLNSYLPERAIQTSIGDVNVQVPMVRDHSGSGARFTSNQCRPTGSRAATTST